MESENERQSSMSLAGEEKEKGREAPRYCISCVKFFVDGRSLSFSLYIHFLLSLFVTWTCSMIVFVASLHRQSNGEV